MTDRTVHMLYENGQPIAASWDKSKVLDLRKKPEFERGEYFSAIVNVTSEKQMVDRALTSFEKMVMDNVSIAQNAKRKLTLVQNLILSEQDLIFADDRGHGIAPNKSVSSRLEATNLTLDVKNGCVKLADNLILDIESMVGGNLSDEHLNLVHTFVEHLVKEAQSRPAATPKI